MQLLIANIGLRKRPMRTMVTLAVCCLLCVTSGTQTRAAGLQPEALKAQFVPDIKLAFNPLLGFTNMPGPQFLVLYVIVIAATLTGCRVWGNLMDTTKQMPLPRIPEQPSPNKVAFLRGGEKEVAQLMILTLIQRGYLQISEDAKDQQTGQMPDHPHPRHLSKLERTVFHFFSTPRRVVEIFQKLPDSVAAYCAKTRRKLEKKQLLRPGGTSHVDWSALSTGGFIILGLGGIKLLAALSKGRTNVGHLLQMGILGSMVLIWLCKRPRLTNLGQRLIKQLEGAFDGLDKPPDFPYHRNPPGEGRLVQLRDFPFCHRWKSPVHRSDFP